MADDSAALTAQINALQRQLAAETARADALNQQLLDQSARADAAEAQLAVIPPLEARIAELERLLAPPPPGSAVLTVTYSDGRVKYASQDGNKYPMASDAAHRNKVLSLMQIGLGEMQAELMLQHGDAALRALVS